MKTEANISEAPRHSSPSSGRAFLNLIVLSWQRQARARWLTWIALGLLGLTMLLVYFNTSTGRWSMARWRYPPRSSRTYAQYVDTLRRAAFVPWHPEGRAVHMLGWGSFHALVFDVSGFYVFSNVVVFFFYGTFLLPLWTLSFATEGLGHEREGRNLIWVLTRPLSRPAIYLAKFLALLPWCLALNLGGLALICLLGGAPGRMALAIYWPAALGSTLAFAALFHALAAVARKPALLALLYSFFFETIVGILPGHLKRLSISYYTQCLMFDRAHEYGLQPERPSFYMPVDGVTAWLVLAGVTVVFLLGGMWVFARKEYLDSASV